jgi:SPP1 family predicted phage head-tail adaptor
MNIAAMRVRVTFQKNAVTVDKYGNHKTGWTDYFSCWATVGTSTGSESTGVVINPEESLDFTCRYCSELAVWNPRSTGSSLKARPTTSPM